MPTCVNPARTTPSICTQSAAGIVAGTSIQTVLFVGALGSEAGAYTRPVFSSTLAISDTKYILDTP
jgi:hypothetical protein